MQNLRCTSEYKTRHNSVFSVWPNYQYNAMTSQFLVLDNVIYYFYTYLAPTTNDKASRVHGAEQLCMKELLNGP